MSNTDIKTLSTKELLEEIPNTNEIWFTENLALFAGDQWLKGKGWAGPQLGPTDAGAAAMMEVIRKSFVSKNVVNEVVSRHVSGILGNDPIWKITNNAIEDVESDDQDTPPEDDEVEDPLVVEVESILRAWWDSDQGLVAGEKSLSSPLTVLKDAVQQALLTDRGPLRLFVPSKYLKEVSKEDTEEGSGVTFVGIESVAETVKKIFLLGPEAEQAMVGLDNETMQQWGIYLIDADEEDSTDKENKGHAGEIVFLDEKNLTHIRIIEPDYDPAKEDFNEIKIDLGGQLTMFEIQVPRLISDSARSLQKQINMILTMMGRNIVQAGFLERILLNAQLPGVSKLNSDTGEEEFVEADFEVGPGVTSFVQGVTYKDADGNEHIADPKVIYRDPVKTETFIQSREEVYRNFLEETKQAHILTISQTNMSGRSRQEARFDFEASLEDTQHQVEQALSWVLGTVLKLVAIFSGAPNKYQQIKVSVETDLNLGRPGKEEVEMAVSKVTAKLESRRTAMSEVGIRDVESEQEQIETEQAQEQQTRFTSLAAGLQQSRDEFDRGINTDDEVIEGDIPQE